MSELARLLTSRFDALIQQWVVRVAEGLAPEGLSEPVIRDHVADVLRALMASLDRGTVPESVVFAREHGKQRYRVGFQLSSLVREYGLLRSLIFDLAEEATLMRPLQELRLVTDFVSVAVAEGVAEYDAHRNNEQRQREQLLTEARLLSDSALTAGSVGTYTWDIPTDRVHGDASFSKLFGIRLDGSGAAPLTDYLAAIHPDDRALTTAKIQRTVEEGGAYEAEYRIVTGGRERWVVARGRVDRDESGRPLRFPGVVMDITDRKRAEEAERALTSRLATALTVGGLGAFEWDLRTDSIQFDDRARQIFAFAPGEPIDSAAVFGRIDPVDRARVQAETEAGIASKPRMSAEYRLGIPDHPTLNVLSFGEFFRTPDGKVERMIGVFRDVTEERQAAEKLRQSEERVRRIVDASGAGLWDLEVESGHIEADARMVELMGLTAGSSLSLDTGLEALSVVEDRQRILAAMREAIAGKNEGRYHIEFRTGGRDGAPLRWVESRARVTFDAHGQAQRLSGAMTDITTRKRVEAEREAARAQVTEVLESMNEAVVFMAPDWRVTNVNRRYEQLSRRSRQDVIGEQLWSLVPERMRETTQYFTQYGRTMNERVPTEFVEYYAPLDIWTDVHAYPTSGGGMVAFLRDISAQRRAEIALQASEERYRTLFESIDEGVCLIEVLYDEQGEPFDYRYLEVNTSFEAQTGLRGVVGKTIREIVPSIEPFWPALFGRVVATGESARVENPVTGMGRWFDVHASRVGPAERHQVVVLFADVTERKKLEQERERLFAVETRAREMAEEASRLKDEFLATMSHELRTPLNAMLGWVHLLRTGAVPEDRQARALETIERNARSQAQLIEDLLDMSRIMSGKLRLEVKPIDVAGVVEAALESIRPAAAAKDIELHAALGSPGVVFGDPVRLQQVAWNLLTNAVKFTPTGGRVQVSVQRVDSTVELTVTDTGQGIDPKFLPHVFERFRQADGGTTRTKGGLGLGLSIVRQLVEMHGGHITAASDGGGKGASFTVRLPISGVRPQPPEAADHVSLTVRSSLDSAKALDGLRLLIVDDEEDARDMLTTLLEGNGALVQQAASAADGRRSFAIQRPDVLVSDIGMPNEDGYAFLRSIRKLSPSDGGNVPAVALTAYARSEDRMKALTAGFTNHVSKPVEPAELIAVVASLAQHARVTHS